MFSRAQRQAQQRQAGTDERRAIIVEFHEQPVALERIVIDRHSEHTERAFARRGHHHLGETQLAHVDVDDRVEVMRGRLQLPQADGGDEQDQQQLDDESSQ